MSDTIIVPSGTTQLRFERNGTRWDVSVSMSMWRHQPIAKKETIDTIDCDGRQPRTDDIRTWLAQQELVTKSQYVGGAGIVYVTIEEVQ